MPPFFFLLLLPFLRQSLASVFPTQALPTKSGYLPVNPNSNSAVYYAFYEAQNSALPLSQTPLIVWLQGGPGCSSMTGNFFELGPYRVVQTQTQNGSFLTLQPNSGSWNRIFGLLFLDNPIGVGFSIAAKLEEIPRDQNSIAQHLFVAISGFLELNPVFKTRPFYITGESYAGKYVPAIGYYILKMNPRLPVSKQVNLKGVAIGNGLTDPVTQITTPALNAYFSGLINDRQRNELEEAQRKAVELVQMGNWGEARNARSEVYDLLKNMTGLATLFDFSKKVNYNTQIVTKLLQSVEVKKALGANASIIFDDCSDVVKDLMHEDIMKSVKYMVEFLVKNTKVLLYQGQLDLRETVVSTETWMKTMKWEEINRFLMAERKVWKVKGEVAGYIQKWGRLSHAAVLGAGHYVPADQPLSSQAMIEDWVLERGVFV